MSLKVLLNGLKNKYRRGFTKQVHKDLCLVSLFHERQKIENEWKKDRANQIEWNDDEDEQRRVFYEEEKRKKIFPNKKEKLKCEITGKSKHERQCECKDMCLAKKSETHLIHYEGGVGIIPQK